MLRTPIVILVLALLSNPAAAITLPFPGGDITDEEDENGKPTGNKLFFSKLIDMPEKKQGLAPNGIITIKTEFDKSLLTIFDLGSDGESSESWHLEVNGVAMKKLQYRFVFLYKERKKTKTQTLSKESGVMPDAPHDKLSKDGLIELVPGTDLFGNPDGQRNIIGFKLFVHNEGGNSMKIESFRVGLDAQDVAYTQIPLPASMLLLGSLCTAFGASACFRRIGLVPTAPA